MDISVNILANNDISFPNDCCDNGHCMEKVVKMLLWASSNTLLNNYCAREKSALSGTVKGGKNVSFRLKINTELKVLYIGYCTVGLYYCCCSDCS